MRTNPKTLFVFLFFGLFPSLIFGQKINLKPNQTIAVIGNTFAERLQHFGHLETLLQCLYPNHNLKIRNLGWSGDELNLQPRPLNFGSMDEHLKNQKTDVIFACFGMNESYRGEAGLEEFGKQLNDFISHLKSQTYNGKSKPQIVLISPIAHERIQRLKLNPSKHNFDLIKYTQKMSKVSDNQNIAFIDIFSKTKKLYENSESEMTINGIHLNEIGYQKTSEFILEELGFEIHNFDWQKAEPLRLKIIEKNKQFFYRWRPVNGEYIYGRRKEPFGVKSFPSEWPRLDKIIADLEREIWEMPKPKIGKP